MNDCEHTHSILFLLLAYFFTLQYFSVILDIIKLSDYDGCSFRLISSSKIDIVAVTHPIHKFHWISYVLIDLCDFIIESVVLWRGLMFVTREEVFMKIPVLIRNVLYWILEGKLLVISFIVGLTFQTLFHQCYLSFKGVSGIGLRNLLTLAP